MFFFHAPFCSVLVRETELKLTCSVWFGQNGKTLLRSVTKLLGDVNTWQVVCKTSKILHSRGPGVGGPN